MFQKLIFPALLFIGIFILSFNQLYAQEEEGEIIIISEKVGEVIDKEEIKNYNLFQGVKGLQTVVFLQLPDGSYVLKATYIDETTGEEKVELTPTSESIIKQYGNRIDQFEEIQLESKEKKVEKPPLNGLRIQKEIICGAGGGFAIGLFIGGAAILIARYNDGISLFPVNIGYTLGSAFGVYKVGNTSNETGSFLATLGGSTTGLILGMVIGSAIKTQSCYFWDAVLLTNIVASPLCATVAFNMTRRYKTPSASETAFINFRDGQTSFAFPKAYFQPNPFARSDLIQTIDLVRVRF